MVVPDILQLYVGIIMLRYAVDSYTGFHNSKSKLMSLCAFHAAVQHFLVFLRLRVVSDSIGAFSESSYSILLAFVRSSDRIINTNNYDFFA